MSMTVFYEKIFRFSRQFQRKGSRNCGFVSYPFLANLNYDPSDPSQKTVLVSYLTSLFRVDESPARLGARPSKSAAILRVFFERGYCVDVVDCRDEKNSEFVKNKKYDVVFGLGEPFYHACKNNPMAKKMIYNAELHPDFSKSELQKRLNYFEERHGWRPRSHRSYKYYKPHHFDFVDIGILQGNDYTARAYDGKLDSLYTVSCAGLINSRYSGTGGRKVYRTKKNFLWFGSKGAVHKGLDLVVEAFALLPDLNLYVCGLKKSEKQYIDTSPSNINELGFVDVQSDEFLKLMDQCSYVVYPSCSEGMPTSVLTCMNHGMIPIITRETGISLNNYGEYILDVKVEALASLIRSVSEWDDVKVRGQHDRVYEFSVREYNLSSYKSQIHDVLNKVLRDDAFYR